MNQVFELLKALLFRLCKQYGMFVSPIVFQCRHVVGSIQSGYGM